MKLEDFKVGMKVRNIYSNLISEVIGITTTGSIIILWNGGEYLRKNYHFYSPYVEKKRVKLYHRLWKYDNNPRVQISSSTAFFGPFADRSVITLKEWEEEIEYEVKD